jgi:hypothetical protein
MPRILRRYGQVVVVPVTVPLLPPAHITMHPEPQPVTVHADAEQLTLHVEVSEQSTFADVAVLAVTVQDWPTSHCTAQVSPAAHVMLHAVP